LCIAQSWPFCDSAEEIWRRRHPVGATSLICCAQARREGGTAAQLDDHLTEAATAVATNDAR
jgi:hypothetical protein